MERREHVRASGLSTNWPRWIETLKSLLITAFAAVEPRDDDIGLTASISASRISPSTL